MISMDLRVLRYFLTVAKEQNFTRAAEQLHITQPTLSRQLAAFEQELGVSLFDRTGKTITLTSEGILLKRRELEMLDIEERTLEELKPSKERIEGKVTVGCGEFMAVEMLAEICKSFKEKYPLVQIAIHTATADTVYEMLHKGLVDVGMFLEPVDTEGLGYSISIRGVGRYWRNNVLVQKELSPGISSNTVIAWRRNIPTSIVMEKFIKEIQSYTSK